jgi:hypothetical protein
MANKTIPGLPDYGSQDSDKIRKDLLEITKNDGTYASPTYGTGASRKITVEELKTALAITSQTVTNGVTTKSPSEDAVFDAILAKGIVKSNAWKNNGAGTFTLEPDKYNIVVWSNTNIEILLPALEVEKTIIVQGTTQDGLGAINFTINNIKVGGADLGTPYSVTVTDEKEVLIFYGNYYGWHLIGHANKAIDISTKLDLDGGNANQDIDIDGFGVNAKHFKVNGTAGAGHIGLKHQSANITASASESSIGADSVGDPVWKNDGGAIDKLELQSNKTGTVTGNEASTSKYLTVKGVYDWAVGLFAPKASPTFTGTVTTPDIVVSGATINTIAHFDGTKNIESLPLATYPSLTELSYVKGVTSAIQTQLDNATEIAFETWSTDANYTSTNTTAKYLVIRVTAGLTATRLLNLPTLPLGATLVIIGSSSVASNNFIFLNGFVNGISTYSNPITTAYGSVVLYYGTGGYSTNKPNFVETATSVSTTKILRGGIVGIGAQDGYPTLPLAGDMANVRLNSFAFGIAINLRGGSNPGFINQYDPSTGWWMNPNTGDNPKLKFWDGQEITSGITPIGTAVGSYSGYYSYVVYDVLGRSIRGFFYRNGSGVPSGLVQIQQETSGLSIAIGGSPAKVTLTNSNAAWVNIKLKSTLNEISKMPELYSKYSNNGQAQFWTGSEGLGIGHTSQNASAIFQVDSTTKGFLPPRMTNVQRTNIVSPAIGLMVYCTDTIEGLYIYKSTGWTFII